MKFNEFKLSKPILSSLEKIGYIEATPIQELAIPKILENKDIIGIAQTGTGKTAAFALPILDKLIRGSTPDKKVKVLVLSPTRELAIQIRDNIKEYAQETSYKCSVILGGVNQNSQIEVLKKGIDILIATPGRLLDLINQGKANMSNVSMLVIDEADTMLDMGFIRDIKSIINTTPKARQTMLFSATMPKEIQDLASEFMRNPVTIKTVTEEVTADKVKQKLYYVDKCNKLSLLFSLIDTKEKPTTLIFTRTKHGANRLEEQLNDYNIKASVIHGNKTQSNRVKALGDFKTGKTRIMIATDIAARGIDIANLELVVNYDLPEKPELYVHRIGRTARAGRDGISITLCSSAEISELKAIEKLIKQNIEVINHEYPMVLQEKKEPRRGSSNNYNKKSNFRFNGNNKKEGKNKMNSNVSSKNNSNPNQEKGKNFSSNFRKDNSFGKNNYARNNNFKGNFNRSNKGNRGK